MSDDVRPTSANDDAVVQYALAGSRVEVVERGRRRLALYIPGGRTNGLGCFVVLWNGFLLIVSGGFLGAGINANGPPWPAALILLLFWAVGLGMGYLAIKMRFERVMLLVEPTRAVIQRTLFGRVRVEEANLADGSSASLVESYKQNDRPVFAVVIEGVERSLKFGTGLSSPEKNWIVDRVNELLGVARPDGDDDGDELLRTRVQFPERCAQCGASLGPSQQGGTGRELTCPFCGHVHRGEIVTVDTAPAPIAPQQPLGPFPEDQIRILERSPERLVFRMKSVEESRIRVGLGTFFAFFALVWNLVTWGFVIGLLMMAGPVKIVMLLFAIPFVAIGAVVGSLAMIVWFGGLRVSLDEQRLEGRWGVGAVSYFRRLPTDAIDRVSVQESPNKANLDASRPRRRRTGSAEFQRAAIVWAGTRWMPLTMMHSTETARHVAQLVRQQLRDMGRPLERRNIAPEADCSPDVPVVSE